MLLDGLGRAIELARDGVDLPPGYKVVGQIATVNDSGRGSVPGQDLVQDVQGVVHGEVGANRPRVVQPRLGLVVAS